MELREKDMFTAAANCLVQYIRARAQALDELAVGPVSNNPQAWKPSWKASPMPGCPPDSDLNAKMATRGREGRA